VADFARRLAAVLKLPFEPVLQRTEDRPEQNTMANGIQKAQNVDGCFALSVRTLPEGPVLLVDDTVDSRWTLTVAAWVLRSQGRGEVFPLVLALAGNDE
jgi:ATP-dependent DNA helicase RecQ